jgi:hypothetical protein
MSMHLLCLSYFKTIHVVKVFNNLNFPRELMVLIINLHHPYGEVTILKKGSVTVENCGIANHYTI